LGRLLRVELADSLLPAAGMLEPSALRTLDAIHLVAAETLASRLGALITYDERMAAAARNLGFPLESPS
jgi:predicted nucleic acid-binding protein